MSSISTLTSVTGASGSVAKKTKGINAEDFMKIMIKELQQQDPTEPVSSKDLLTQISQISNLQSATELSQTLKDLAASQKLGSASSLLGKVVHGVTSEGKDLSGMVTGVKLENDNVYLELDSGEQMDMNYVTEVYGKDADMATGNSQKT